MCEGVGGWGHATPAARASRDNSIIMSAFVYFAHRLQFRLLCGGHFVGHTMSEEGGRKEGKS